MLFKRFLGIAATLAVFSACADTPTQPVLLETPLVQSSLVGTANRTVKMVPFHSTGGLMLVDASGVVCPEGETPRRAIGWGIGNQLGKFTSTGIQCIDFSTGIWSRLDVTFTAANGDQMSVELDAVKGGRIDFSTVPPDVKVYWNVIGGTGRFEGAIGTLTLHNGPITGTISSPGSG